MGQLYEALVGAIHVEVALAYGAHESHAVSEREPQTRTKPVGWYRCVEGVDPNVLLDWGHDTPPHGDGWVRLLVEERSQLVATVCGGPSPTDLCDELGSRLFDIITRRLADASLVQLLADTPESIEWDDGEGSTPLDALSDAFRTDVYERLFHGGLYKPGEATHVRCWRGAVIVEGVATVDDRIIEHVTWDDEPLLPIFRLGDGSVDRIGVITKLWRVGGRVLAQGAIYDWTPETEQLRPCADLTASEVIADGDKIRITGKLRSVVFTDRPPWPDLPFQWGL